MTTLVKFFTDEKGKKMVQMSEAHYKKITGRKISDPNLLDTDEQCKRMKNEIRKKYNAKSETKVEYLI